MKKIIKLFIILAFSFPFTVFSADGGSLLDEDCPSGDPLYDTICAERARVKSMFRNYIPPYPEIAGMADDDKSYFAEFNAEFGHFYDGTANGDLDQYDKFLKSNDGSSSSGATSNSSRTIDSLYGR